MVPKVYKDLSPPPPPPLADPGQSSGGDSGVKALKASTILFSVLLGTVKKTHFNVAILCREVDNETLEEEADDQTIGRLSVEQEGIVQNIYLTEDDYGLF